MLASLQQIVTFARDPFGGNPAYVLVAPSAPEPIVMQALCQHLHEPILAVLWEQNDAVELRHFTANGPHGGMGHATHAAAYVALTCLRPTETSIDLRLGDGKRRAASIVDGRLSVDWPVMEYASADVAAALADCLGRKPAETYTSAFGVIAVFDDASDVANITPDLSKIGRLPNDAVIVTARAPDVDFVIRVFAPKLGLPEDPVCGTAQRILVPFWAGRLERPRLVSHQLSPRGGRLFCELVDGVVRIGGDATPFIDGTVSLPESVRG